MNLKNFKKNPVFLWAHRGNDSPENVMGTAKKVWVDGKNLMFKLEFLDEDINPRSDMVFKMFKSKALRAFSIGFAPDWEKASFNEKRGGFDFPVSELLEISAVPVPANPAALTNEFKQLEKTGNADEAEIKDFEIFLEENYEEIELKDPIEKQVFLLQKKVEDLEKRFDTPPEVKEEVIPVEEPEGEVHIVDRALAEFFEPSDDKSINDSQKNDDADDLNTFVEGILNDG
jgi:HK97 family phage prohead protease